MRTAAITAFQSPRGDRPAKPTLRFTPGHVTLCEKQENYGYSLNGTFAEYAVVPAAPTPQPRSVPC